MKLITHVDTNSGIITVQRAEYIEDGWFIQIDSTTISLYEIPMGGGDAILISDKYKTLMDAVNAAQELS